MNFYPYRHSPLSNHLLFPFHSSTMLSLGKFTPQLQFHNVVFLNPTVKIATFLLSGKTQFYFSSNRDCKLRLHGGVGKKRNGFCVYASKNAKKGENRLLEMEGFDEDEDFLDEEEEKEEDLGEGEDDEETFIPLINMKNWLENKPRGFGEGKEYDTSIEDKLMEEIEQSRTAQLANINKLKNNPVKPVSKKETTQQEKESKEHINGYKVRLVNLPTKKNIHRDLRLAFKEVPGIIDIVPVISGNKKTRDPICKGLAFVYFRQESDAQRFVESFSGQSISFGKVQKQIKCVMDTSLPKPAYQESSEEPRSTAQSSILDLHDSEENVSSEHEVKDEMLESAHLEEIGEDSETHRLAESRDIDDKVVRKKLVVKSSSSKQDRGSKEKEKLASKRKKEKAVRFNVLGSANRLRIREKQVLTGAFSKYGATASLATTEQK